MKNFWKNIGYGILIFYGIGISGFIPYYNWQYARSNGVIKWVLFGEVVATAKGIAWPYFVAKSINLHNDTSNLNISKGNLSEDSKNSIIHMVNAIEYKNYGMKMIDKYYLSNPKSQIDLKEISVYLNYLEKALTEANKTNRYSLNSVYPELGDHFFQEFIKGLQYSVMSFENKDVQSIALGENLLHLWHKWYKENRSRIIKNLQ